MGETLATAHIVVHFKATGQNTILFLTEENSVTVEDINRTYTIWNSLLRFSIEPILEKQQSLWVIPAIFCIIYQFAENEEQRIFSRTTKGFFWRWMPYSIQQSVIPACVSFKTGVIEVTAWYPYSSLTTATTDPKVYIVPPLDKADLVRNKVAVEN